MGCTSPSPHHGPTSKEPGVKDRRQSVNMVRLGKCFLEMGGLFLGLWEFDENVAILSFLSMMRKAYFNGIKKKKNLPVLKTMRSSMTGQQDDSLGKVGGRGAEHRKIPPQW